MKGCPRCMAEQDDVVAVCDCGYEFPTRPPSLVEEAWQSVARLFRPPCPQCGSREISRVGEFVEVDVLPERPLWTTLTRGSLLLRHKQSTYLCNTCANLWTD
jgi:hypothetical protein